MQGTVYEKTNAEVEMKKINREEFWEQAKVGVEQERRREEGREWRKIKMDEGNERNSLILQVSSHSLQLGS